MSTHVCMWWKGTCSNVPLPTVTPTGHYLCEQHMAQATADMIDAQRSGNKLRMMAAIPPLVIEAKLVPMAEPKHHMPRVSLGRPGRWVPPILFVLMIACTVCFPLQRGYGHLGLIIIWLVLIPTAWLGWVFGFGDGHDVPRGGINTGS